MKRLSELKKLEVLTYPKIKITQNKEETKTLAHYQPSNDEIVCYVKNRLMADVFRSIAHEIVHFFQKYNNELDLYSGETGSDIENEANSLAGVILREFGEIRPEIFYNSFNVRDTSLVKIEINENEEDKINYLAKSRAGFRAGHIEGRKPEDMQRMDSNRSTGHFGTGYYFFGDIEQANNYSKQTGNRDVRIVDFSDYRLFVPNTEYDGFKLHDFFKKLNNNDYSNIARKKSFELLSESRVFIFLNDNKINFDKYQLKNILDYKDYFEQYFYDSNKVNVLKEFEDYDQSTVNGIINYVDIVVRPTYKNNLRELFTKEILPTLIQLNKKLNLSKEQVSNVAKIIFSDYRIKNNQNRNSLMSGKDTLSTRIMKYFGWEGIDVRGMNKLDNSEYGSVIYDIKPSSIIKESENKEKHKYGCLMLKTNIPNWSEISNVIKEDDLFIEDDKFGREDEQHITILYGFLEDTNVETIKEYIKNTQSVDFLIKGVSIFENEKFDVVKLSIESENLNELNKYFSENYKNENKFPDYIPHMTIAYVKKGEGKKYVKNFKKAIKSSSNKFFYSSPNNEKVFMDANKTISECDCEENEEYKLDEYAQNIIDKLFKKFREENENLTDEQISYYIQRFDQLKSSPKVVQKDILKYSFQDLEKLVDSFPTKTKTQKSSTSNDVQFSDGELIYNKAPLQLFHGDSPKQCIKIKGDFPASWCIARTSGNMYHNYRFGNAEPSFYFVKNLERLNKIKELKDDPYCFFVVQINNQGKYIVTSSLNDGDKELTWEQLLHIEPLLNGTQSLFVQKELDDDNKYDYRRFRDGISDEEYEKLSFDKKKKYISIYGGLTYNQFINTPNEIKNDYITMGADLTDEQLEYIKDNNSLLKNYKRVTINLTIPEELENNSFVELGERWSILSDDEIIEIVEKLDESEYDISEIILYKPTMVKYFQKRLSELSSEDIAFLLSEYPNFVEYFENSLSDIHIADITKILSKQPSIIEYFLDRLDEFGGGEMAIILKSQPDLLKYFVSEFDDLSNISVLFLLRSQPQLKKYFSDRKEVMQQLKIDSEKIQEYDLEDDKIDKLLEYLKKKTIISEAQYQGRSVTLNKPMRGDVKKFKVYVKNKKGKVVKVNFGSKDYNIKKNNPNRKKSYCSRSKGIEGGGKDKTKANYWSRRQWKC